jgi:hypothetical protein
MKLEKKKYKMKKYKSVEKHIEKQEKYYYKN